MLKHLHGTCLKLEQDYVHARFTIVLPPDVTIDDLFVPTFWAHHTKRLTPNTIVRCIAHDRSFDIDLTVAATPEGNSSVVMQVRPYYGGLLGEAALPGHSEHGRLPAAVGSSRETSGAGAADGCS